MKLLFEKDAVYDSLVTYGPSDSILFVALSVYFCYNATRIFIYNNTSYHQSMKENGNYVRTTNNKTEWRY